jgi:hypothetical protein
VHTVDNMEGVAEDGRSAIAQAMPTVNAYFSTFAPTIHRSCIAAQSDKIDRPAWPARPHHSGWLPPVTVTAVIVELGTSTPRRLRGDFHAEQGHW